MIASMTLPSTITIGLDVGDRTSHWCQVTATGEVLGRGTIPTTAAALARHAQRWPGARIVLEVGTHSPWLSRALTAHGHEVLVANARQVRLIYAGHRKTDRLDAECLARLGRLDPQLLHPIQHRGAEAQADLAQLRARDSLIRARTQLINHVRGAVKAVGGRVPACSAPAFTRTAPSHLPPSLHPALEPVLTIIADLTQQIRHGDQQLAHLATTRYPETARLRQVPGVGPLTALCYVLTLEDPHRFRTGRSVGAYLGLVPRLDASGARQPQLRITKRGDAMLRRYLVNGAHYVLGPFGPDSDLRQWGLRLAARGGTNAKKRAVIAVARKLATLLHALWITDALYEPRRAST